MSANDSVLLGEAEMMDLKGRITDTEKKVVTLDSEVKEYLENHYARFAVLLQENHLMIKAKDLITEVANLRNRVTTQVSCRTHFFHPFCSNFTHKPIL